MKKLIILGNCLWCFGFGFFVYSNRNCYCCGSQYDVPAGLDFFLEHLFALISSC